MKKLWLSVWFLSSLALGNDLDKAPNSFDHANAKAVFVDISNVELIWSFNPTQKTHSAKAVVKFYAKEAGFPVIDLIPSSSNVVLNGVSSSLSSISVKQVTTMKVLAAKVQANSENTLELQYLLPDVSYSNGAVRFGTFMGDLSDRNFFEQYAPTNLEYDQYVQNINVEIAGDTEHRIYSNGFATSLGRNKYRIHFPGYFTTSSFYFHISESGRFIESNFTYDGLAFGFPVTIYASSNSLVQNAVTATKRILAELESTYGMYGHDSLTIYITSSGGGMEYCGATMTSMGALGHELTHSWFARGVMPSNGNAGWIDEAIASWRDNGYPRRTTGFSSSSINLGNFSEYKRYTTRDAYSLGMKFISYLDGLTAEQGGMRSLLRLFWIEKRRQTVSVQDFQTFLETKTNKSFREQFNFYVYGQSVGQFTESDKWTHPRPYTKTELRKFR